jgi:hypothetical protein
MARRWLDQLSEQWRRQLPKAPRSPDQLYDFEHVREAIAIVEKAIEHSRLEAEKAGGQSIEQAVANPYHSYIENPVFARLAVAMWRTEMTFPLILRRALFIAICSHTEHVLKRWCRFLHAEWKLQPSFDAFARTNKGQRKSTVHLLVLYLGRRGKAQARRLHELAGMGPNRRACRR